MIDINEIKIEYKTGVIFGLTGLVLSVLTGFVTGVGGGDVFIRSILISFGFTCLGIGFMFIFKKYVPEIYNFFYSFKKSDSDIMDVETNSYTDKQEEDVQEVKEESDDNPDFNELGGEDLATISANGNDDSFSQSLNTSEGKLGKHVVTEDASFTKYEPKLLAEAVRTMMKKDGE